MVVTTEHPLKRIAVLVELQNSHPGFQAHFPYPFARFKFMCCIFFAERRYLKSQEDQEEDLPGLEDDAGMDLDFTVLRRRTMATAAERRMQHQQEPAV